MNTMAATETLKISRLKEQIGAEVTGVDLRKPIDEATRQRRAAIEKTRTSPPAMIDRGEGYEKMLRGEHRPRMR